MARRKFSRTGGRTPGYQVSPDHFQTASRIPAPDWAEKVPCIILPNQEPAFAKPFGNGPVRLGTQGFFRPFLKTFVAPFRPPPTDCPWVSEDVSTYYTARFRRQNTKYLTKYFARKTRKNKWSRVNTSSSKREYFYVEYPRTPSVSDHRFKTG